MYPTLSEFEKLAAGGYQLIPVWEEFLADSLTPVRAYRLLVRPEDARRATHAFLLESVEGGEHVGRYSFLGAQPYATFKASLREVELNINEKTRRYPVNSSLGELWNLLGPARAAHLAGLPRFAGGAVGYIGYDAVRLLEKLPAPPPSRLELPDLYLMLVRELLVFDHLKKTLVVLVLADLAAEAAGRAYQRASARVRELSSLLAAGRGESLPILPGPQEISAEAPVCSNFTPEAFAQAVERVLEYIRAGDIIQAVLSQRFSRRTVVESFDLYRALRVINPSPYMFLLEMGDLALVGSSPEMMVQVEERRILVRPIAGTRPRGGTPQEDERIARELVSDPKERAEHLMLLDLGRNDLGRVAEYGTVRVESSLVVENYSHVMHLVSEVSARLREGATAGSAFQAAFPAGTVTGAPKIRAMEIIDELEPDRRGPYAGAVGYFDYRGNLDTAIAIRTVMLHQDTAYVQAGAGIVADSVPEKEYRETRHKARALFAALSLAEKCL